MKVTGYVWIQKTGYVGVHDIGIVCDDGQAYAHTNYVNLPKIGDNVLDARVWVLNRQFDDFIFTKLHKLLAGIENAD